ncbi:LacI family DNA-binding transcriptional regulator, partial [Enterococcus faecalis]|nr:LacI family DNA-binding transcriptional regulator [Enterococcus faecalis]
FKNIITELVKKISKPMVFIDSYYDLSIQNPQILFVNNDDRKLAYEATKVLLNYGYRNIAFFSPAFSLKDDGVVPQRYLGYLDALLEFGLAADDKLLFSEEKLTNFIEAEETYSASIINSDYLAAQYLYKLRERNQQFKSLISFDNNIFSQLLNPPLSTVDLRQKEKGRIAVKLINDMLQRSEKQFERNIMIEGQLISRESVLERTE